MDLIDPMQFVELLPLAASWAQEQESYILEHGEPLSDQQLADAKSVPVTNPQKVRLLSVNEIPLPKDEKLRQAAKITGFLMTGTIGLALRYGIYLISDYRQDRRLIVHELAHVVQYERCGGILEFLQQYLYECITIGYPEAPMEQQAISTADRILSQNHPGS